MIESLRQALKSAVTQNSAQESQAPNLSQRELQVCSMVNSGYSSKEIALALNISPSTVVNTRKRIRKKMGISGQAGSLATYLRGQQD
jgi:DNA-binding CsgD family transcriptional regulator